MVLGGESRYLSGGSGSTSYGQESNGIEWRQSELLCGCPTSGQLDDLGTSIVFKLSGHPRHDLAAAERLFRPKMNACRYTRSAVGADSVSEWVHEKMAGAVTLEGESYQEVTAAGG